MRKFTRIKKIHDYEYAYEITPYYDKKTKQIRQKSKYLGKLVDGEIKRINMSLPVNAFDYGDIVPLINIIEELTINNILKELLPENKSNLLLTIAINRLVNPVSMDNIKTWYERTYLHELYGNKLPLSSSSLSTFLEKLGSSNINMEFCSKFIKRFKKGGALVYDVTSLSSYSKLMDLLEYGYNRDSDGLPQINLSVAVHKEQGLPIYYDIYPGSITDTSILHNTIEKLATFDIDDVALILDKGFFSETNLNDLRDAKLQFMLPATFKNKCIKALVTLMKKDIEKGKHLQKYNGNILFVKEANITLGQYSHNVYVFFDPKRESDERIKLYHRLHSVIETLEHRKLRKWEKPTKVFEDIVGEFKQYMSWRVEDNTYKIKIKEKAVAQRLNRMGFTIMFYSGEYSWNEVWGWYHERDIVEKVFLFAKNYLETVPFNAQKTEVAKGLILVGFIALILRFKLLRMMKDTDLNKHYSIPKLLLELSKIKRIKLKDGQYIISEISKKQREIIKALKIDHIISCA